MILVGVATACGPKHGGSGRGGEKPASWFEPAVAPQGENEKWPGVEIGGTGKARGAAGLCPAMGVTWGADRVKVTVDGDVLFDFDKTDVKPVAEKLLAAVKTTLVDSRPGARVVVEGHTDSVGADDYNLGLSQRRAASVAATLVGLGVGEDRIEGKGYGEKFPRVKNDTDKHRALNRRVEIVVIDPSIEARPEGGACRDACCALEGGKNCVPVSASWPDDVDAHGMEVASEVLRLQICEATRTGAIWITSTNENKIAKLDERTGKELFRKNTWGNFPNRTSVAADGSVWVTNRDSSHYIHLGADGEPLCASAYDTCYTRAAAVDADGNAWIGCNDLHLLIEVSGTETSGTVELTDPFTSETRTAPKCKELARVDLDGISPYGLVADREGALWVGVSSESKIAKVDTRRRAVIGTYAIVEDPKIVAAGSCWSPYGLTIDPDGNPWYANYGCGNVVKIDGVTGKVLVVATGGPGGMSAPRALGVDQRGHVWAAENNAPYVDEFGGDGTWIKRVDLTACGGGSGLLGTGSDSEGQMWTVAQHGNRVAEYDVGGKLLGCYPERELASPYTYSDFTGSTLAAVTDRGRVTVVLEDERVARWLGVAMRAAVPVGTSVCARARVPNGAWSETWCAPATDGPEMLPMPFPPDAQRAGSRLEVEVQLASSDPASTPLLYSLGGAGARR